MPNSPAPLRWSELRHVFLDMDGTLLDLHFDNHFWLEHVPRRYAEHRGVPLADAHAELRGRYARVEGTMNWYCLDYWTAQLGLDILDLKHEVADLIAVKPHVREFLDAVRASGRQATLVTNAHPGSLALKLERTALGAHLDHVVCSHTYGVPKEDPIFWERLRVDLPFDPRHTVLFDDSLAVLRSAAHYGLHVMALRQPDSRKAARDIDEFAAVTGFDEVMPD